MEFILSDGSKTNSKGYKVAIAGIGMARFTANPVMLKEHNHELVIGRWENMRKENNQLIGTPVFDTDDPEGKEIARKVEKNFLRCASVGIIPMKLEYVNDEYILTECELVEASIVSVPSDSGAVRLYNDQMEELSFEQVKLNFEPNNKIKMELKLSQKTIESLSLGADYTPKDVELAVAEKDREIATLKADLASQKNTQITEYLCNAVKVGKITEAEKASYLKLAETDFDSVKAIIDAKEEKASASLKDMETKSTLAAGREGWDYLKWMKEDSAGLQKLRLENPKEFKRLQETIKK